VRKDALNASNRYPVNAPQLPSPVLVVSGLPEAAADAKNLGVFKEVIAVVSTAELLKVIDQHKQVWDRDDVVFMVGDKTEDNHKNLSLAMIVLKLANNKFKVIVVTSVVGGINLAPPTAHVLSVPLTAAKILYAVNSLGYSLNPDKAVVKNSPTRPPAPQASEKLPEPAKEPEAAKKSKFSGSWGPATVRNGETDRRPSTASQAPVGETIKTRQSEPVVPTVVPAQSRQMPAVTPAVPSPNIRPSLFNTVSSTPSVPAVAPPVYPGPVPRTGYTSAPAQTGRRGYVVTVAVAKGGTGKSSLTLNLAAYMGMRASVVGKTVCVIDSNFQQADAGKYLSVYVPNIHTITNNPALLTKEYIQQGLAHKPEYNLSVLLGPATVDEGNPANLTPELYNQILDLLKYHYDYIFIDTPVAEKYHQMFENFSIPKADYIVVPVTPNMATIHDTDNWLKAAVVADPRSRRGGIAEDRIGIVLNRAEENIGCDELEVQRSLARWEYLGAIPETPAWKLANNRNELVVTKQNVHGVAAINAAIASILYKATGEPCLLEGEIQEEPSGLWRKIFRRG